MSNTIPMIALSAILLQGCASNEQKISEPEFGFEDSRDKAAAMKFSNEVLAYERENVIILDGAEHHGNAYMIKILSTIEGRQCLGVKLKARRAMAMRQFTYYNKDQLLAKFYTSDISSGEVSIVHAAYSLPKKISYEQKMKSVYNFGDKMYNLCK